MQLSMRFNSIKEKRVFEIELKNFSHQLWTKFIGDDTLGIKLITLKRIKLGELEEIYLYLNDSIDRQTETIQGIASYFEEKGVTFKFISCDDDNNNDILI